MRLISLCMLFTFIFYSAISNCMWDWSKINTAQLYFPKTFLWGTALCEYQNSGAYHCKDSNWAHWESSRFANDKPHIVYNQKSGKACNFWENYREDIHLMKEDLGVNSLRFSIEWSIVEPQEGVFNNDALEHYADLCDRLIENNIEPMITLHHFTHPQWFENKGAFEYTNNITYFVRFCRKVFEVLGSKVRLWCTINEPNIYTFQGYVRGVFPPGKSGLCGIVPNNLAVTILKNLLQAHVEVYQALKAMPYGEEAKIGLVHQYLKFEPYSSWNINERIPGLLLNYFLNDAVLHFCKTGLFNYNHALSYGISTTSYRAPQEKFLDFIGLNYYSRVLITMMPGHPISSCYSHETMTDMPYAMYAQGLYTAIKDVSTLQLPIYITENGVSDAKDNRRALFIKQYLYALSKALLEGYDVRGFYYWSLTDNFEWDMGYTQRFGLYAVNLETQERTLKEGSKYYSLIIKQARQGLLAELYEPSHIPLHISSLENYKKIIPALGIAGLGIGAYLLYNQYAQE